MIYVQKVDGFCHRRMDAWDGVFAFGMGIGKACVMEVHAACVASVGQVRRFSWTEVAFGEFL